jgi:hypothetical protein
MSALQIVGCSDTRVGCGNLALLYSEIAILVFTIPNNVSMHTYKKGNENLLHAINERHVLPSGENLVLFLILTLQYAQFSTKFIILIRRNSHSSYAVFIPNYVRNAISYLPYETQILELTTKCFQTRRLTKIISDWPQNKNRQHKARITDIIFTLTVHICRLQYIICAHGYLITHIWALITTKDNLSN